MVYQKKELLQLNHDGVVKNANEGVIFTNIFGKSNPDETNLAPSETKLASSETNLATSETNSTSDQIDFICFKCKSKWYSFSKSYSFF